MKSWKLNLANNFIKLQSLEYPEDDPPPHISKIGRVFFYIVNYAYKWKGSVPLQHMQKSMEVLENQTHTWDHQESDIYKDL